MLVQVWRWGRGDEVCVGENVLQTAGGLPPVDTIQHGIAEAAADEEEDQEQEQQSRAWDSRWWMDLLREGCLQDTLLHSDLR
jgi:hypothetical protein